ncbi:hypothetical protein M1GAS476_1940 [Streptococcus pyogenes M1 476]|nr:hypothetical protein M1GAS476_1940 [Streptococcus pyogenes M1 476]
MLSKEYDSRASTSRNVKTGPFSGSFEKATSATTTPSRSKFRLRLPPSVTINSKRLMILTKCDSISFLLFVFYPSYFNTKQGKLTRKVIYLLIFYFFYSFQ